MRVVLRILVWLALALALLAGDVAPYNTDDALLGRVASSHTFDFWGWELGALTGKLAQNRARTQDWLSDDERKALVLEYVDLIRQGEEIERQLEDLSANLGASAVHSREAADLRARRDALRARVSALQPVAEAILEEQIGSVLAGDGLGPPGGVFPPVSIHITPLPYMLIISPRDRIEARYQIGLEHGLPLEQQEALESGSDQALGMRSLVVPIGGLALYPAMLLETSSLDWAIEASAHEWVHQWLLLRPLGMNYDVNPEARKINETVASIAGQEIGEGVVQRYYPELSPKPGGAGLAQPRRDPAFDYAREMHATRVHVDELLAQGRIDQAEAYMEARRQIFVANGYNIRKLNQAFFAFYGGYQAEPGGPAGEDPVGPAVRDLRARTSSVKAFLDAAASVTTLAELRQVLAQQP